MIVEDSAPPGVLVMGRLAGGTADEARRVAHASGRDITSQLVRTKGGEAFSRTELEWPSPGAGLPCEPCLGLAGVERARSPRRELGV
ncbi:hypothetical protein AB0M83_31855 [Amycolatopsis sp. NPDC051106]|uniref:hypothetical protein n=1 Tax=unclassified Amycolatopsis TaxID=2618356 RepID=UPI00343AEA2F